MSFEEGLTVFLLLAGCAFFGAGTLGLLRFPDVYTRLHALTKADNVGLGLICAGLALQASTWLVVVLLLFIWLLVLLAGATGSHLVAQAALRRGVRVWKKD